MTQKNEKTIIYKMAKKWKLLLLFSLLLNVFTVIGVVQFSTSNTDRMAMILSKNVYPPNLLSNRGVNAWRKRESTRGYNLTQDVRKKDQILKDLTTMLKNGAIPKDAFISKMQELNAIHNHNFERFINNFPEYWNTLTDEQRRQYMKTINTKGRYHRRWRN